MSIKQSLYLSHYKVHLSGEMFSFLFLLEKSENLSPFIQIWLILLEEITELWIHRFYVGWHSLPFCHHQSSLEECRTGLGHREGAKDDPTWAECTSKFCPNFVDEEAETKAEEWSGQSLMVGIRYRTLGWFAILSSTASLENAKWHWGFSVEEVRSMYCVL